VAVSMVGLSIPALVIGVIAFTRIRRYPVVG
jgi:hypothetical protein